MLPSHDDHSRWSISIALLVLIGYYWRIIMIMVKNFRPRLNWGRKAKIWDAIDPMLLPRIHCSFPFPNWSTQRAQTSAERQHNRIAEWFLQCKLAMQLWFESTRYFFDNPVTLHMCVFWFVDITKHVKKIWTQIYEIRYFQLQITGTGLRVVVLGTRARTRTQSTRTRSWGRPTCILRYHTYRVCLVHSLPVAFYF